MSNCWKLSVRRPAAHLRRPVNLPGCQRQLLVDTETQESQLGMNPFLPAKVGIGHRARSGMPLSALRPDPAREQRRRLVGPISQRHVQNRWRHINQETGMSITFPASTLPGSRTMRGHVQDPLGQMPPVSNIAVLTQALSVIPHQHHEGRNLQPELVQLLENLPDEGGQCSRSRNRSCESDRRCPCRPSTACPAEPFPP